MSGNIQAAELSSIKKCFNFLIMWSEDHWTLKCEILKQWKQSETKEDLNLKPGPTKTTPVCVLAVWVSFSWWWLNNTHTADWEQHHSLTTEPAHTITRHILIVLYFLFTAGSLSPSVQNYSSLRTSPKAMLTLWLPCWRTAGKISSPVKAVGCSNGLRPTSTIILHIKPQSSP